MMDSNEPGFCNHGLPEFAPCLECEASQATPTSEQERERALAEVINAAAPDVRVATHAYDCDCARCGATDRLRDCVPVPKDELARLRSVNDLVRNMSENERGIMDELLELRARADRGDRALMRAMWIAGYPDYHDIFDGYFAVFQEAGFADSGGNWTPKAHAFAKEMQSRESNEQEKKEGE